MSTDEIGVERLPPSSQPPQSRSAQARSTVLDWEQQARTLIRQRPVVAVLAAAGIGYLLARVVSRAMR